MWKQSLSRITLFCRTFLKIKLVTPPIWRNLSDKVERSEFRMWKWIEDTKKIY